jgi:hypothetical protein
MFCVAALGLVGVLGLGTGCAETEATQVLGEQPGLVKVQAPEGKCWSGAFADRTEEGCGSKSIKIEGEAIIVANAQKQDPGKWKLELVLEMDGKVVDKSETTAEFGIATVHE